MRRIDAMHIDHNDDEIKWTAAALVCSVAFYLAWLIHPPACIPAAGMLFLIYRRG